jgi:hypothetical protein
MATLMDKLAEKATAKGGINFLDVLQSNTDSFTEEWMRSLGTMTIMC